MPGVSNKTQATPIVMEQGTYSTALSVTIAIGCSLLILNMLIFAGVYYQLDKAKTTPGSGDQSGSAKGNESHQQTLQRNAQPPEVINLDDYRQQSKPEVDGGHAEVIALDGYHPIVCGQACHATICGQFQQETQDRDFHFVY